jgi:hypothetical protein
MAALLSSCQLEGNLNGLARQLGNPEKDNFDTPGELLLAGKFTYPSIEGNSSSGAFITAMSAEGYLTIVEFETKKSCKLGPLASYRAPSRKHIENVKATPADILLPVMLPANDDQPRRLAFTDLRCKQSKVVLDTEYYPLEDTFAADGSTITQDMEGNLWSLHPLRGKKELIASLTIAVSGDARAVFADGLGNARWMYTIEDGEIVARDNNFKETFRWGHDIRSLMVHKDARGSLVVLARTENRTWTSVPVDAPKDATQIATRGCSPRIYDGKDARLFLWIDCDTQSLEMYDYGTKKVTSLASKVSNYRIMGETDKGPLFMYLDADGAINGDIGPLYAQWGDDSPVFLGNNGNLRSSWVDTKGAQRPLVDWDLETNTGTLKYAAPGKSLETVAKKVVYLSSLGVISDYDGTNGKFSRLSKDELSLVHKRVHSRGLRVDPDRNRERLLISANVDDDGAELVLVTGADSLKKVIDGAMVDSYAFAINPNLVSVLSDRDPEDRNVGTLNMVNVESSLTQVISTGVVHALETTWPRAGILYSAPKGDVPGLYFAKATR